MANTIRTIEATTQVVKALRSLIDNPNITELPGGQTGDNSTMVKGGGEATEPTAYSGMFSVNLDSNGQIKITDPLFPNNGYAGIALVNASTTVPCGNGSLAVMPGYLCLCITRNGSGYSSDYKITQGLPKADDFTAGTGFMPLAQITVTEGVYAVRQILRDTVPVIFMVGPCDDEEETEE